MCDTSLHHVHGGAPKTLRRKNVAEARGSLRPLACCCRNLGMLQIARTMTFGLWWAVVMSETMGNNGATIWNYIYIYLWIDVWIYGYMDIWIDNQHDIWIIIIITWQNIFLIIPLDLMTEIS